MKAYLILQDGSIYEGEGFGAEKEVVSELVFCTSMAGYVENLTDPSNVGQALLMTYPIIGSYGVCREDMESDRIWADALIVRELSEIASNFRSETDLNSFLLEYGIPGIQGIDTRDIVLKLRNQGTMNVCLTYDADFSLEKILSRLQNYRIENAIKKTTTARVYQLAGKKETEQGKKKIAVLDLGAKRSTLQALNRLGYTLEVYPAKTAAAEILAAKPDALALLGGGGDPKEGEELLAEIKLLADSSIPVLAVGLGHQLVSMALGANVIRMKFGHRGSNYPVKDPVNGRAYITMQNHGYAVEEPVENSTDVLRNVNDQTVEGYRFKNILSIQFEPDGWIYERFLQMLK